MQEIKLNTEGVSNLRELREHAIQFQQNLLPYLKRNTSPAIIASPFLMPNAFTYNYILQSIKVLQKSTLNELTSVQVAVVTLAELGCFQKAIYFAGQVANSKIRDSLFYVIAHHMLKKCSYKTVSNLLDRFTTLHLKKSIINEILEIANSLGVSNAAEQLMSLPSFSEPENTGVLALEKIRKLCIEENFPEAIRLASLNLGNSYETLIFTQIVESLYKKNLLLEAIDQAKLVSEESVRIDLAFDMASYFIRNKDLSNLSEIAVLLPSHSVSNQIYNIPSSLEHIEAALRFVLSFQDQNHRDSLILTINHYISKVLEDFHGALHLLLHFVSNPHTVDLGIFSLVFILAHENRFDLALDFAARIESSYRKDQAIVQIVHQALIAKQFEFAKNHIERIQDPDSKKGALSSLQILEM
ncbi:MAG: hypothetical protein SFU25_07970 [Candidatus Caenarcaniphilales bacterium]|nr:hypothetical protein [Candidatus Caenarcaniphilales bacterium]